MMINLQIKFKSYKPKDKDFLILDLTKGNLKWKIVKDNSYFELYSQILVNLYKVQFKYKILVSGLKLLLNKQSFI